MAVAAPATHSVPVTPVSGAPLRHVHIAIASDHPTLRFARDELRWMLAEMTACAFADAADEADLSLTLLPDATLPTASWAVRSAGRECIALIGHDESAVLAAAYTLLEHGGVYFDVTGPVLPESLDVARMRACANATCTVIPTVIERGVRQHINFPMDISSYPLAEAKTYLHNLARLRCNQITFHSYPQQWYSCALSTGELHAGRFFYGVRYDLGDDPLVASTVRNTRVFCIPEIEALYDRPLERAAAAETWLRALMAEAHRVGMHVQFSLELRGEHLDDGLAACEAVLQAYPDIDTLELITPENKHEPVVRLGHYLAVLEKLRARHAALPCLAVGVYETDVEPLRTALDFLRRACPADIYWTFLPSHGARTAAANIQAMGLTPAEWQRTRSYSWFEFDGMMYHQQNSLTGARQAVAVARSGNAGGRVAGIAFNHWRTSENRLTIGYGLAVCIDADLDPADFSRRHAAALGISDADVFATAMTELDDLDTFCRDHLFNIGFCHFSCWRNKPGLGWTRKFRAQDVDTAQRTLEHIDAALEHCLHTSSRRAGRRALRFLRNRIGCTVLHLRAIAALVDLHEVCVDTAPEALDAAGRQRVHDRGALALSYADAYLHLHAADLPDRGSEGTLINYRDTIPAYIRHLMTYFLGGQALVSRIAEPGMDDPPAPERVGLRR